MSKRDWNSYSLEELGNIVSDWYKDVHGMRPRFEGLYEDKARLVEMAESLEGYMESMHSTFAGRESLREEGWFVAETDPELAQHALWLAEERDRRRAEYYGDYYDAATDGTAHLYRKVLEDLRAAA